MSLIYKYALNPNEGRHLVGSNGNPIETIINNSEVVSRGDVVTIDSNGNVILATAGSTVFGIVESVEINGIATAADSGTVATWTMASDNETVSKKYAKIDVSMNSIYSATQNGTVGTTAQSGRIGAYIDLVSASSLAESTASRTAATGGQFTTLGTDPDDTTRILVIINETILYPDHA